MKTKFLIIVIGIIMLYSVIIDDSLEIKYAYAGCATTILPQPCFDSFMGSTEPLTEKSIMENFARYIEVNYLDWQMSDRNWDNFDEKLKLPAIICTEFVAEGITQYRMAKWVDVSKISSFEDHRNDWMCNKWLPPIDDGIKVNWDKPNYFSNDTGIVQVTDKNMNLDSTKIDSFDIHVWSDTDHTGIDLTIYETDNDHGIFEARVFFTPEDESQDTRLLVEDAVYAEHKSNVGFSRITNGNEELYPTPDITDTTELSMISYGHQWVLTIILIVLILIAIPLGVILGVKVWRKRK